MASRAARVVVVTGVVAVAGLVVTIFAAGLLAAGGGVGVAAAKSALHAPGKRELACERRGGLICRPLPAAVRKAEFPLGVPDPRGASVSNGGLLTEQEALAGVGWTSTTVEGSQATVGAALMTYGQAHAQYALVATASAVVVEPSREVWVLTRYYSPALQVVPAGGHGPAGGPVKATTEQDPYDSVVVDAATGQETDACMVCAAVPENASGN
jgi:hypothetical protein